MFELPKRVCLKPLTARWKGGSYVCMFEAPKHACMFEIAKRVCMSETCEHVCMSEVSKHVCMSSSMHVCLKHTYMLKQHQP